jgi:tetratricopeptide (TPR) repeat protein
LALHDQDIEKARSILHEVIQKHPDSPEANLLLGDLHYAAGEFPQAAERYQKALAHRQSSEVLLKLGKTRSRLGEAYEAEKHFRKAVQGEYESEALLELASLYLRNPGGQWGKNQALSQALESCDRALVADPLNIRARNLKAMAYAERRQLGPMLNELNKSLSIDSDQPDVQALVDAYQSTESP